jgi:chromatin remodeling complex protein RSC6
MAEKKSQTAKSSPKSGSTKGASSKSASPKSASSKSGKPDALQALVKPSSDLATIVGDKPLPRGQVISKMWEYIKKNKLQNPDDGREIIADDKLAVVFGKKKVTMFELTKIVSGHLTS